jgi:hypothetical protein
MSDYEYRIDWIQDHSPKHNSGGLPIPVPPATTHLNALAAQGWEPTGLVPGTNAQTYSGLYLTFRRPTT